METFVELHGGGEALDSYHVERRARGVRKTDKAKLRSRQVEAVAQGRIQHLVEVAHLGDLHCQMRESL